MAFYAQCRPVTCSMLSGVLIAGVKVYGGVDMGWAGCEVGYMGPGRWVGRGWVRCEVHWL